MVLPVSRMIPQHSFITVAFNANVDQVTKESIVNNQSDLAKAGIYHIVDSNGNPFPVRCHFKTDWSWTLIQSFENRSNLVGNISQAVNEDDPNIVPYRLSHFRMVSIQQNSSKWRINHGIWNKGCWDVTLVAIDTHLKICTSCVASEYFNTTDNRVDNTCNPYPCQNDGKNIDNYGLFCCFNSTSNECPTKTRTRIFLGQRDPQT